MHLIGIDPDLHRTAIALVEPTVAGPMLRAFTVFRVPTTTTGSDAVVAMSRQVLHGVLHFAACAEIGPNEPVRVAIEGQSLVARPGFRHRRPDDIVHLAQVAGAALAACVGTFDEGTFLLPRPGEWKGQVAKHAHQARTLRALGIDYEFVGEEGAKGSYARPTSIPLLSGALQGALGGVRPSDWRHLSDAAGLALWAAPKAP